MSPSGLEKTNTPSIFRPTPVYKARVNFVQQKCTKCSISMKEKLTKFSRQKDTPKFATPTPDALDV